MIPETFDERPHRKRGPKKSASARLAEARFEVQQVVLNDLLQDHHIEDPVERSKILRAYMLASIKRCYDAGEMELMHKFLTLASKDIQAGILPAPTGTNISVQNLVPGGGGGVAMGNARSAHVPTSLPPMSSELQRLALSALPTGAPTEDIIDVESEG